MVYSRVRRIHAWLERLDVRRQLGGDFGGLGRPGGEEGGASDVGHRFEFSKRGLHSSPQCAEPVASHA